MLRVLRRQTYQTKNGPIEYTFSSYPGKLRQSWSYYIQPKFRDTHCEIELDMREQAYWLRHTILQHRRRSPNDMWLSIRRPSRYVRFVGVAEFFLHFASEPPPFQEWLRQSTTSSSLRTAWPSLKRRSKIIMSISSSIRQLRLCSTGSELWFEFCFFAPFILKTDHQEEPQRSRFSTKSSEKCLFLALWSHVSVVNVHMLMLSFLDWPPANGIKQKDGLLVIVFTIKYSPRHLFMHA